MKPIIALIVARARNGVIGCNNRLPWHLPADLRHFRSQTVGQVVIMGRKTFESIGKPLPERVNIVVTRSPDWRQDGVTVAHSLDEALEQGVLLCRGALAGTDAGASADAGHGGGTQAAPSRLLVMGGAELYRQALPLAGLVLLTEVWAEPQGDAWFEALSSQEWVEVSREHHEADEKNPHPHDFVTYERRLYA